MAETVGQKPLNLIVVVARRDIGPRLHKLLKERIGSRPATLFLVMPALAESALDHLTSDIDESAAEATHELHSSIAELKDEDWTIGGEVGDADPLLAIEDAMRQVPADEIVVITLGEDDQVWAEEGLFTQIDERFGIPATHIVADGSPPKVTERATAPAKGDEETEVEPTAYGLPAISARDLAAIVISIVGTIVLVVSIAATSGGLESSTGKLRALLAVYAGLLAVYNVFRFILNEAVRFRRLPIQALSWLSILGVPIAVMVGLVV
jgi:hypothetical protein